MQVTLYGAANEVTGSCYLLETKESRILIDCGLFQGPERLKKFNRIPANIFSRRLDAVILTHGHLDHCGRLPLLVRAGYNGPIYTTQGSIEISRLVLSDAARIQHEDTERENRHRHQNGLKPISALFDQSDVERVCTLYRAIDYGEKTAISKDVNIQLVEAGHILGSASAIIEVSNSEEKKRIVFSGDLGPWNAPIMRDPAVIEDADIVFMESTYGDRDHKTLDDTLLEFENAIRHAILNKGKILIPTFAVGRTQQLLYHLAEMFRKGVFEPFPIYLDSPMAIAATELYRKHPELMDEEARALEMSGQLRKDLASLRLCPASEDSRALNSVEGPCLILAGAGMCNAGRILHHLRHNLANAENVVIIVGYQVKGSTGRHLVEGAETVKILGETIHVRAAVRALGGFSAHAGQSDLLRWLEPMARKHAHVILTHGEANPINELYHKVEERFSLKAERPKLGNTLSF
ncbi:MAG: MBL fold metallo-hydrolase [Candidatus Obscuribacterales bacterium]|nr:MBL fold metallo-hydrolase [Candidatus Obscuribacterales bacterium]